MDQELKQRLIGASVIIALAIIFVPMLFDGETDKKNNQNISIIIPEAGENNLEVKKFELDKPVSETNELPAGEVELVATDDQVLLIDKDTANQADDPLPETNTTVSTNNNLTANNTDNNDNNAEIDDTQVVEVATAEPVQEKPPVEQTTQQPIQQPVQQPTQPKTNVTPGSLNQAYRVKLGSFSQQANAEKVKSSLLQKNIKAIVEYNPGLKLYRVWSQELYQDAAKANAYVQAVEQLKLNIGTPKVVTLNAQEVSQMANQGQMGWVVQLGSFSAKDNAIELRNKVKAAGFSGFVDVIFNNKGVQLYRLRIGPLMEKSDAEKTQAEIKQKLKLDGLVKTHELGQIVD